MVEIRAGDLWYHRLQFWPGVGGHGPLDKAKVTGAEDGQFARKPLLLLDPCYGGQSVIVLIAAQAKLASRARGATATLNEHLVAPFDKRVSGQSAENASPAVR